MQILHFQTGKRAFQNLPPTINAEEYLKLNVHLHCQKYCGVLNEVKKGKVQLLMDLLCQEGHRASKGTYSIMIFQNINKQVVPGTTDPS